MNRQLNWVVVRSFGTEGRRGKPEEEILASDNVFDYVVFRGSDIKDLQVFEAPPKPTPPPPPPQTLQDPAIMVKLYIYIILLRVNFSHDMPYSIEHERLSSYESLSQW